MNDLLVIVLIFISFFILALIIKYFLERGESEENNVQVIKEEPKSAPSIDLINDEQYKKTLENFNPQSSLEIPIGIDSKGNTVLIDLAQTNNLLIIGTTGGGKSICLNEIITSILMTKSKDDIKIVTIDTSMVELSQFNYLPHYVKSTIISPNEVISEINELKKEILRRRTKSVKQPLLVIIDDLYDVCTYSDNIQSEIIELLKTGGPENIYFILTTDTPNKEIITDQLKNEISGTIYLTLSPGTKKEFGVNLTKKDLDYLASIGNAIYLNNDKKEKIVIPDISDETLQNIKDSFTK